MSKKDKRTALIMEKPARKDISYDDMCSFLLDHGFVFRKSRGGGSHRAYTHSALPRPQIIKNHNGLIKRYIVEQVQEAIEIIGGE